MSLTGPQKLEWQKVFANAFGWNDFNLLLLGIDDGIENYVAQSNVIRDIILRAIMEYEQRGEEKKLLFAVLAARPNKPEVVELARSFGATTVPERNALETLLVDSNSMLDFGVWLENAVKIQQAVCRIEIPLQTGGTTFGTGFLIAPELVMTNYHVVAPLLTTEEGSSGARALPNTVTCRFDYRILSDGTKNAGTVYRLAPQWQVLLSPNNRKGQEATADELDCAVLRLARPAGSLAAGEKPDAPGTPRGWIKLPENAAPVFAPHHPLFIVQHPQAKPIKLALDTGGMLGANTARTRVRYRTNSEPGSSGSPCFDQDWNLIAVHHSGDPNFAFEFNEGIPIDPIVASLKNKGIIP
jgi:hypothetical protein